MDGHEQEGLRPTLLEARHIGESRLRAKLVCGELEDGLHVGPFVEQRELRLGELPLGLAQSAEFRHAIDTWNPITPVAESTK